MWRLQHGITSAFVIVINLILVLIGVQAEYSPVLNWDVCTPSRIIVTLSGAADGGIIYIKGYGAACKQTTTTTETVHEFDFSACGIKTAETYFTIIVQKNPLYQTGHDLQESLICIFDLSDLSVGPNILNVEDLDDGPGINKTVKPTVQMMLYKNGLDVSGSTVKLSDLITMTIQLDAEYIDDFDIKAKSCTANYLDITTDFCAVDKELFPEFTHVTRGVITATFGAFRTTDLGSGLVEMAFSCTVQVCQDSCSPSTCDTGSEGWGRKKRAVDSTSSDDLSVGASLSIGTTLEVSQKDKNVDDELCINILVFVVGLALVVCLVITSLAIIIYVTSRHARKSNQIRKMAEIDESKSCSSEMGFPRKNSTVSVIINDLIPPAEKSKTSNLDVKPNTHIPSVNSSTTKQASVSVLYNSQTLVHSNKSSDSLEKIQTSNAKLPIVFEESTNGSSDMTGNAEARDFEAQQAQQLAELKLVKQKLVKYQEMLRQCGMGDLIKRQTKSLEVS